MSSLRRIHWPFGLIALVVPALLLECSPKAGPAHAEAVASPPDAGPPLVQAVVTPAPAAPAATAPATHPEKPAPKGQWLNQAEARTNTPYRLYLPAGYRADRQCPMVFCLMPVGPEAVGEGLDDAWAVLADREGWLLLGIDVPADLDPARAEAVVAESLGRWSVNRRAIIAWAEGHAIGCAARIIGNRPARFAALVACNPVFARPPVRSPEADKLARFPVLVVGSGQAATQPAAQQPAIRRLQEIGLLSLQVRTAAKGREEVLDLTAEFIRRQTPARR